MLEIKNHPRITAIICTSAPIQAEGELFSRTNLLIWPEMQLPDRIALLQSHVNEGVSSLVGSVKNLRVQELAGGTDDNFFAVVGDLVFSSRPWAQAILLDVLEGHLRNISIGYKADQHEKIPLGETRVVAGRQWFGGNDVITSFELCEASLVLFPKDPRCKILEISYD